MCTDHLLVLETFLTPSDVQLAVKAYNEENLHLLQILLYNNDVQLMMYQMLRRRTEKMTVDTLLDDFSKVKAVHQAQTGKILNNPVVLKSAKSGSNPKIQEKSNHESTKKSNRIEQSAVKRVEADYVIGKLIEDHLAKSMRQFPKK